MCVHVLSRDCDLCQLGGHGSLWHSTWGAVQVQHRSIFVCSGQGRRGQHGCQVIADERQPGVHSIGIGRLHCSSAVVCARDVGADLDELRYATCIKERVLHGIACIRQQQQTWQFSGQAVACKKLQVSVSQIYVSEIMLVSPWTRTGQTCLMLTLQGL